ncbi:MAG: type III polyketide synthase [Saprospiraceae bacterium]|nr:type III polyketide synthase [Saprospiraceae bacterium]
MSVKITTVATVNPPYTRRTEEVMPFLDVWLEGQEARFQKKVKKLFQGSGVEQRYSIMNAEDVFTKTSFEAKNEVYKKAAKKLGKEVLEKALHQTGLQPTDIDILITVSCTGIMIPSLDAYLMNSLNMRQDVLRLPVTEMGCVAGVSGIIYAKNFLKARPNQRAAVIAIESSTATFQLDDFSMENIVSSAIFGDGVACAILSSHPEDTGAEVVAEAMYHLPDATDLLGFRLTNSGMKMVLSEALPSEIGAHFNDMVVPFLAEQDLTIQDIEHMVFHPGGKKIVQTVEALFEPFGKNINATKEVMRTHGNMSSTTILYVLERFFNQSPKAGEYGLMLSFGPGFTAQRVLLQW